MKWPRHGPDLRGSSPGKTRSTAFMPGAEGDHLLARDVQVFGPVVPAPVQGIRAAGAVLWAALSRFDYIRYDGMLCGRLREGTGARESRPTCSASARRPAATRSKPSTSLSSM